MPFGRLAVDGALAPEAARGFESCLVDYWSGRARTNVFLVRFDPVGGYLALGALEIQLTDAYGLWSCGASSQGQARMALSIFCHFFPMLCRNFLEAFPRMTLKRMLYS